MVAAVEQAAGLEAAADALRPDDVTLPTALRWTRRRVRMVYTALTVVVSLLPDLCLGTSPTIESFRILLGCETALIALREATFVHLPELPRPLGFRPPQQGSGGHKRPFQQHKGPDPPTDAG